MKFFASDDLTKISGRTLFVNHTRYLGYSGSSVSFSFYGKSAKAKICSDANSFDDTLKGQIAIFINQEEVPSKRIMLLQESDVYSLYESDIPAEVTITIMKYSEAAFAYAGIEWIETDAETLLPPPKTQKLKLEIIGDSITCGYGVEAEHELIPFHTQTENPTKSYSLLTAKALDAEVNLVSWSGNGIISKYVEETAAEPLTDWLMPELYPFTDKSLAERVISPLEENWPKWDFANNRPDIILINLGTNDASYCKDIPERHALFQEKYQGFVQMVRKLNPGVPILSILGTMDQRLIHEVQNAVENLSKEDANLHVLLLPIQNPTIDGYGADYHPSPSTHLKTRDLVIPKIKDILKG